MSGPDTRTPEQKAAQQKAWYEANKEHVAARGKAYYEANKVKIRARNKAYAAAHRDATKARHKAYHDAHKAESKVYRAAHKDEFKAYRESHKDAAAAWHRRNRYSLTPDQYEVMFTQQNGLCASCGIYPPYAVDHDHDTDIVRGLLCNGCNVAEGHLGGIEGARKLVAYLERFETRNELTT
jgi:hypothetical protein